MATANQKIHPELLKYYEQELQFTREMGKEFAQRYPGVAQQLDLDNFECADPYVERLLEGFAFLSARIQLKLDAEFPKFTQHLLETVYPHYLSPIPSMSIMQFVPDLAGGVSEQGFNLPKGTELRGKLAKNTQTRCKYHTAHDVKLWPIRIMEASYLSLGEASYYVKSQDDIRSGIKLRLKTAGEMPFQMLSELNNLVFYLDGGGEIPNRVYELLFAYTESIVIQPASGKFNPAWTRTLSANCIQTVGFKTEQALLPYTDISFQGYRLFQEYFNFPQRYLFFDLQNLSSAIQRCEQDELEIIFLFNEENKLLQDVLSAKNFSLNCTPAINLFKKSANHIRLSDRSTEHHVIPERTKPMDYEVYAISNVLGFDKNLQEKQQFRPFYACEGDDSVDGHQAYYSLRREPRLHTSNRQSSNDYIGTEVFISLVDASETPYSADLKQLAIGLTCTNRNLPQYSRSENGKTPFTMQDDGPIERVYSLTGLTAPKPPHPEGEVAWRLISQLSLNYLSLLDQDQQKGAAALRQLLSLYSHNTSAKTRKQINGILSVESRQIVRRIPGGGPITFGRGVEIVLTCKDSAFEGSGVFLLGSIIEQFFSKYVSLNSFTQTVLKTVERGMIKRWPIRIGTKAIL